MNIERPLREPDYNSNGIKFWFEEMLVEAGMTMCKPIYYIDDEYLSDSIVDRYRGEYRHEVTKAYIDWLTNKEIEEILLENNTSNDITN